MNLKTYISILFICVASSTFAQHHISINSSLDAESKTLTISQKIVYVNNSNSELTEIYLNDWPNSFSSKTTPLAKRFAENYVSSFHFEKLENRGKTTIFSILNYIDSPLVWERGNELDIIRVKLDKPLAPNQSFILNLKYKVLLPDSKFTRYGVTDERDFKLQYWFISPAVFDGQWHAFSNKNTRDLYLTPSTIDVSFETPEEFTLVSDFDLVSESISEEKKTSVLRGEERMQAKIHLLKNSSFKSIVTDKFEVLTNLNDTKVTPAISALMVDRIVHFLDENLGAYPFAKMVVSQSDYKYNPVYGLNQLPNFISPFPDGFEYDMQHLKTISRIYLENTLAFDPREDHWLIGALHIYLMTEYVEIYYPNMKIIGNLSNYWVIRWAHIAKMEFNDQYAFLYLHMARNNLHQTLTTPKDSLTKFNKNIANDYYAGDGLKYLSDYLGKEVLSNSIKDFYSEKKLHPVHSSSFQKYLEDRTDLPLNWFFENYLNSRISIDFKISKVEKVGDSLKVQVKNNRKNPMPVSLYGINKDRIVFKNWLAPVYSMSTVMVPAKDVRKLVLNYEAIIPEINQRNNYKNVTGFLNRPLQFRFFKDIEDPRYNQVFFMPVFQYNFYDGFSVGPKIYNKTLLPKAMHYRFEPQYAFKSKTLVGKGALSYTSRIEESKLYSLRLGVAGSYYSYNEDLFYKRLSPFMTLAFRSSDLRNNKKQFINIRNVNVYRDKDPDEPVQDPNYSVFNLQYVYSNPNLINYFRSVLDYQISAKFSKVSATLEYRKLFLNNRQFNLRFFAGAFLYNNNDENDDFFSFALDRPTDYLFDYNYYGRSEDTGLFSQQLILAEGGFKSQLTPAFSNSWMATVNASTNIWKWIYAYGDVGLVHNKNQRTKCVYDSGIRVNFVADYFELYFPMYSNLGWEPGLKNYDQKIRFVVTLDFKTLFSLFSREWY